MIYPSFNFYCQSWFKCEGFQQEGKEFVIECKINTPDFSTLSPDQKVLGQQVYNEIKGLSVYLNLQVLLPTCPGRRDFRIKSVELVFVENNFKVVIAYSEI